MKKYNILSKIILFLFLCEVLFSQIYRCPGCSAEIKYGWEECPRCGENLKNFDWRKIEHKKDEHQKEKTSIINRTSVGINYPGISFKYISKELIGAEIKYQISNIVQNISGRVYRYFAISKKQTDYVYTGGEFNYIIFSTDDNYINGNGIGGALFVGYERILFNRLGLGLDVSTVYISLEDKEYKQKDAGIDFVLNLGMNFYF